MQFPLVLRHCAHVLAKSCGCIVDISQTVSEKAYLLFCFNQTVQIGRADHKYPLEMCQTLGSNKHLKGFFDCFRSIIIG